MGSPTTRDPRWLLIAASAAPLLLFVAGEGTQWIGLGLLGCFGVDPFQVRRAGSTATEPESSPGTLRRAALVFGVSVGAVLLSARFVVVLASEVTTATGLGRTAIGATVVALGTSLPERSGDLLAVRRRLPDLTLGDIVGSCVTNVTLVLGVVLVLTPIRVNFRDLGDLIGFALRLPVLMLLFLRMGRISGWQPMVFHGLYGAFGAVTYGLLAIG